MAQSRWLLVLALIGLLGPLAARCVEDMVPKLSHERVVFQIAQGDIEFAFFPEVGGCMPVL